MALIGAQENTPEFSIRARPNTREIYVKYTLDDVALDFTLTLPKDYPLHPATIQQDSKLRTPRVNTLRKNLFVFINNRNGALLEAIEIWKRSVEKQIAGVDPCSICLMTGKIPRLDLTS